MSRSSADAWKRTANPRKLHITAQRIAWGIVALGVLVVLRSFPLAPAIVALRTWAQDAGNLAPTVFVLVYAVPTVALIPASPLTLVAGALLGLVMGTIVTLTGATIGASLAFLISRHLARPSVGRWAAARPTFSAVDHAVTGRGAIRFSGLRWGLDSQPPWPWHFFCGALCGTLTARSMRSLIRGAIHP